MEKDLRARLCVFVQLSTELNLQRSADVNNFASQSSDNADADAGVALSEAEFGTPAGRLLNCSTHLQSRS